MSDQTVPVRARLKARRDAPPIVARRQRAGARPRAVRWLARAVGWVLVAVALSASIVALAAVISMVATIGVLSADLADPGPLGSPHQPPMAWAAAIAPTPAPPAAAG